jgi:hypothetical protein
MVCQKLSGQAIDPISGVLDVIGAWSHIHKLRDIGI